MFQLLRTYLFCGKLKKYDLDGIKFSLIDQGVKREITKDGVWFSHFFRMEIENRSERTLSWVRAEVVQTTTREYKIPTISYEKPKFSDPKFRDTTSKRRRLDCDYSIAPGQSVSWDGKFAKSTGDCERLGIYQVYGEYTDGEKFMENLCPSIDFHDSSVTTKTTKSDCFVTTAAYGDPHHPMVQEFRDLRDQVLVNFAPGRTFIDWYNKNGPAAAQKLSRSPFAQTLARGVLTPIAKTLKAVRGLAERRMPSVKTYLTAPRNQK